MRPRLMLRPYHFCRNLLLSLGLALASGTILAQSATETATHTPVALPAWVVLVLKPVGADRVQPVTGVVISDNGLVIVPQGFAAPGDQIIVLDDGTDIAKNGRAATISRQLPDAGLTLLSAPLLKRHAAKLSAAPLADGEEIRLAAFPPAELIAKGAAPVTLTTQVTAASSTAPTGGEAPATPAIALSKPLPNVTGPLLDSCGNLVGFSSAEGVQSMETTRAPVYLWKDGLMRALQSLPVQLETRVCPVADQSAEKKPPVAESAAVTEPAKAAAADAEESKGTGGNGGSVSTSELASGPVKTRWLPWLGLLVAAVLAGLAWWLFRRRATFAASPEEPGGVGMTECKPEAVPPLEPIPDPDQEKVQTDCVMEISGRLPDGEPFINACDVHGAAINAVIGRGNVDLVIDSKDVQREHVRLSGSADMLTISDLGSSRGTWINRVPCLKGEIMFIGAEDTIFLGDVSFQVTIRARRPTGDN